jgi:hypothetical protein
LSPPVAAAESDVGRLNTATASAVADESRVILNHARLVIMFVNDAVDEEDRMQQTPAKG